IQTHEWGDRVHRSPSIHDSEILRVMNILRSQSFMVQSSWNAGNALRRIQQAELSTTRNAIRASVKYMTINEFGRPFGDIYDAVINTYAPNIVQHGEISAANIIFERQSEAVPFVEPSYLMYDAVVAELTELFSQITSGTGLSQHSHDAKPARSSAANRLAPIATVLDFGRKSDDANHLGFGWSAGEVDFRWMTGSASELWLENPGTDSDYVVELKLIP